MIKQIIKRVGSFDWLLLVSVIILFSFGITAIYSVGIGKEPQDFAFMEKQLTTFGIGLVVLFAISAANYRTIRNLSPVLYGATTVLLVAVLVFGSIVRGTKGWFLFGTFGFQPVEFAKISLVLILAYYFNNHTRQITQLRHIFISGAIAAVPIILVAVQPDFGSAVIMAIIWLGMILLSGIPKRYVLILVLALVTITTVAWFFLFKDYQRARVITFINPTHDELGTGYNVKQAIIAIGSGQIFGKGIGSGSQSHLKFLPENQTDFIFSVIAEEMGFAGILVVFLFWALFFVRLTTSMRRSQDDFSIFTVLGAALIFFAQVVVNIGGNVGVLPLTGLVLPFMSYGGSALLAHCVLVGLVESVHVHSSQYT